MVETLVDVAIPTRVSGTFHYLLPEDAVGKVSLGSVIRVRFHHREMHAFVLGFPTETDVPRAKLKPIDDVVIPEPVFDEAMLKFLRWVAEYYCHPLGEVIAMAVPKLSVERVGIRKRAAKGADAFLARLEAGGEPTAKPTLNEEQAAALDTILDPALTKPVLLHGVTGSGKTEVYMSVLERVLAAGKGAIILVPEIALTPQLLGRFSGRFPGQVAVLHSDLTPRERHAQWERLRVGKARIVVGARSAVFAPVKDLGLIVVDEEHESSFKQEDSARYHGRDVAVVRGMMTGARVVLGSATPSVESYANAKSGKYVYVQLKKRVQDRPMPRTTFVDIKDKSSWYSDELPWISRYLVERIGKTLKEKQQTMLFLNRLGFAHFLFCKDCGHTWRCRNCDVALTYYRSPPLLKCHYCGLQRLPPDVCEECQGRGLETMGLGTEQVERELTGLFPTARFARLDRSVVKTRKDLEEILTRIASRDADIVIGTQMMAKGHDFPGIALVGILVADSSLNLPDFRAHERTFQLITQVAGRAGRAETPGEVVIQTLNPEHPVLRAAAEHRAEDFYRWELDARQQFGFPPHQRLAMLRFQHKNLSHVEAYSHEIVSRVRLLVAKQGMRCQILGPAEAPLSRLKNFYRWQCLLKSDSVRDLQGLLRRIQDYHAERKSPVQMAVDVDPINAL